MTAPINPVPLGNTAQWITPDILATYGNFMDVPYAIRGLDTTIIHISPKGVVTHLAGPSQGQEGIWLAQMLQGEQMLPFEQVITETAFQWGATIERTNYKQRLINFRVAIFGRSLYEYQMADTRWWDGQDETQDGWLGVFTRFGGWRWIPVRPLKTVDTAQRADPTAYGNNLAIWDITWVAQRPYYSKPSTYDVWTTQGMTKNPNGWFVGTITLANQGDMQTYAQYIINGAGRAIVQDNNSNILVELPPIVQSDGPCLCDTDPMNRTLVASDDPYDKDYYNISRANGVLNFLLGGSSSGINSDTWWRRGYVRFVSSIPGETVVNLTVAHTNPNASITAIVPQRYKRSR